MHVIAYAVVVDTGRAIYVRHFSETSSQVAYVAHFAGFTGGQSVHRRNRFRNFDPFVHPVMGKR